MRRNLDGYFFKIGGEDVCFSDLSELEQDAVLEYRSKKWLRDLCKHLAFVIKDMGDQLDITAIEPGDVGDA